MVINHDSPITNEGFSPGRFFWILKMVFEIRAEWQRLKLGFSLSAFGNIETWWPSTNLLVESVSSWPCHEVKRTRIFYVQLFDQFVDPFLLLGFDFWFPPREKWHVDCNLQQHFPAAHLFSLWICLCFQKGRPQRRCSDQKKAASRRMNSGPPNIAENHWDLKKLMISPIKHLKGFNNIFVGIH